MRPRLSETSSGQSTTRFRTIFFVLLSGFVNTATLGAQQAGGVPQRGEVSHGPVCCRH